ncbi:alpha/beta hydrolase [Bacillus spongiae]|uniref:Alpha/beta hydrolase n=1 Tax=Bacillus spongiae TaxID=2683610 RepID=A0ABU8HGU4_9BACI
MNQRILINNHNVEVQYKGNTGPLIVILTGMGCSFDEWHEVIEMLSKNNRMLTFHRPGLGQSELGNGIRNTETTVQDLDRLLHHFEIKEPFYLVGHSYGGLCAQHFAKAYPDRLAGIILVDSTSVELTVLDELELPVLNEDSDEAWIKKCLNYASKEKEQLQKIIKPSLSEKHRQFPERIQQRLLDFQVNPLLYRAMTSEIQQWKKDAIKIKQLGEFPDVPLMVIGRDKKYVIKEEMNNGIPEWELKIFEEKWEELIKDQAKLSTSSKLIFAKNSGHSVYLDRPDLIIECIQEILTN